MTRKDYEAIASVIRKHVEGYADMGSTKEAGDKRRALVMLASELSREFTADNPRFQSARFMKACGAL